MLSLVVPAGKPVRRLGCVIHAVAQLPVSAGSVKSTGLRDRPVTANGSEHTQTWNRGITAQGRTRRLFHLWVVVEALRWERAGRVGATTPAGSQIPTVLNSNDTLVA